ncbi:futalosine hydrolase [Pedobacter sp. HDW13]|uniref:futalosine hydrolase n=1 Tax=unclassified Pedobacter TaxID=2628915 RepID=UPI000F5923FB|nr:MULTISPECIES: futalosine hydrolase [unclassified Pedobacter]QIL39619.1 futalosine hydrolase [Pedobacter sp. HDW13]RQO78496.1 futalosine hydrolase [Pedobacter sp. KBW01]
MKTLVVAATKAELSFFYQHFNLPEGDFVESKNFDLLITGVGMVATAFALGKYLSHKYELVVNFGIAGCFDRNIALGTVLNISEDTFAELGAESGDDFLTITDLGFGESHYTSRTQRKVGLPLVKGITMNRVTGSEKSIKHLVKRLNPTTESMEGAAVFYACKQLNIDCLQIRSISNYVEPRNKDNWKIGLSIKNLNDWAIAFIGEMN